MEDHARLRRLLLSWYRKRGRALPWRVTGDPWRILVSEVMLQQTQAGRVAPVYTRFVARFPTPGALASATVGEAITAWQGLGYNRRAVNLHRTARLLVECYDGRVPADLAHLLELPGVGAYTARAVLAFAFGLPAAPVDTNVARVLARAHAGRPLRPSQAQQVADELVAGTDPRRWTEALMDLGATHCTARSPRCRDCPLEAVCAWQTSGEPKRDPARRTTPQGQQPFAGSSRYHRGRLVDALRRGPVPRVRLPQAAELPRDPGRAAQVAGGLVADGLAQWVGDSLYLPTEGLTW